jgi:hypothetical protein
MKNKIVNLLKLAANVMVFAVAAIVVSSCKSSEDTFSTEDVATTSNESTTENTASEVDDMAANVLNGSTQSGSIGGRTDGIVDDRLTCTGIKIEFTNVTGSGGTATITFPAEGCTDKKGNVRKGQITITWSGGKWYNVNSTHTITLANYSINGLSISGTRTVTTTAFTAPSAGSVAFSLTQNISGNHTYTWTGASTGMASRIENKTKKWDHTATEDTYTVSNGPTTLNGGNTASGTNRNGKAYTMNITKPLIYLGSCVKSNKTFIPVSGTKQVVVTGGKTYTVDYGDGQCNTTFTVTVGGISKTITAKNDNSAD